MQARGVNVDKMFSDRIKDEDKRFERVENAVKDLRREFDAVKPSILKLVAVEEDMQDLVAQLQTLLQQEPPPAAAQMTDVAMESMEDEAMDSGTAPPAPANARATSAQPAADMVPVPLTPPAERSQPPPVAAPPAPPQPANAKPADVPSTPPAAAAPTVPPVAAPETPPAKGGATVRDLRIGEHEGKTRLVFDVTGPATYRYDIDNDEKLMIVELPGTEWAGKTQWTAGKAPLLASYTVSPLDGGGSRVIIELKQAVSVVYESKLGAGGGEPWRIVIDIGRSATP